MRIHLREGLVLCGVALMLAATACERGPEHLVTEPNPTVVRTQGWLADSADVRLLASGLAQAMAAPEIRQQLLEDMRDSPFDLHSLPLGPYLRGTRGALVLRAMASALAVSLGRVEAALGPSSAAGYFLSVPRSGDRLNWDGTVPFPVIGTASSVPELGRLALAGRLTSAEAQDVNGNRITINVGGLKV